jgi:O-antigen ligase
LEVVFWSLLFVLFPFVYWPQSWFKFLTSGLLSINADMSARFLVPKAIVFIVLWGAGLALLWRRRHALRTPSPAPAALGWLALFLAAQLVLGLSHGRDLHFTVFGLQGSFEAALLSLAQAAYLGLILVAWVLLHGASPARRLLPLKLMACGAALVALWTLGQVYLPRLGWPVFSGNNITSTLGHQGFVAAFLGVALVTYGVWRLLAGKLRILDVALFLLLVAALVACGGRAGLLAAIIVLVGFLLVVLVRERQRLFRRAALLLAAGLLVGIGVALTSSHAQHRLDRVVVAAKGSDPSLNHRLVFWQVGFKALLHRPLTGYGANAFPRVVWRFASPRQAKEIMTEYIPRSLVDSTVHLGRYAATFDPSRHKLELHIMDAYSSHNYFLDMALSYGIPVTLLFTLFLLSSAWALYKTRTPLALAVLCGLATYLLYAMFWFSTLSVDPVVWGLLGIGLSSVRPGPQRQSVRQASPRGLKWQP